MYTAMELEEFVSHEKYTWKLHIATSRSVPGKAAGINDKTQNKLNVPLNVLNGLPTETIMILTYSPFVIVVACV